MARMGLREARAKIRILPAEAKGGPLLSQTALAPGSTGRWAVGAGFTLLELLCVLTLLTLMLGFVAPNLYRSWQKEEAKASVRRLLLDLRQARSLAIAHNRTVKIFFDLEQNTYEWEKGGRQRCGLLLQGQDSALVWQGNAQRQGYLAFYSDGSSSGGHLSLKGPADSLWVLAVDKITGQVQLHYAASWRSRS